MEFSNYVMLVLHKSDAARAGLNKEKNIRRQHFIESYFIKPIITEGYTPLLKEEIYKR